MKIAIIGTYKFDSIEYHLDETIKFLGHQSQVFHMSSDMFMHIKIKNTFFMKMAEEIIVYNPDLVMVVNRIIHPDFVIKLKALGYKIIHVNPDPLFTFDLQQLFVAEYDLYFVKDPYIKRFMESNLKLNVKLYNEAFSRRVHTKPDVDKLAYEKEFNIDVMTYGTFYPYRNRMLRLIADQGINITLFGDRNHPFFDESLSKYYTGSYITGETKAKILYGAKIVLNTLTYAEIESVNNRFFEVNGSGGFQLLDYRPILKDLLPVAPELVSFKSIDEAIEKIRYYLQHPEERAAISQKIYDHFIDNYTYDHLIQYILNSI